MKTEITKQYVLDHICIHPVAKKQLYFFMKDVLHNGFSEKGGNMFAWYFVISDSVEEASEALADMVVSDIAKGVNDRGHEIPKVEYTYDVPADLVLLKDLP